MNTYFSCFIFILFVAGCTFSSQDEQPPEELPSRRYSESVNWVDTAQVTFGTFHRELPSNGKLVASRRAELAFEHDGLILDVVVKNGQRVRKGQVIARLDDTQVRQQLRQAKARLAQSDLDRRDALISAGYLQVDSANIPAEILTLAALQSGYTQAKLDLQAAQHQLDLAELRAPFSGTIADLKAQPYQHSQDHRPFCLVQDLQPMQVAFFVLETELGMLEKDNSLIIEPLAREGQQYTGSILSINPRVESNGMVEVVARVDHSGQELLPGMNVRIILRQAIADQLIIPKEAVVLRQGRPVVFVYQNDTAYWHYVTPGLENSHFVTVREGLTPHQTVITDGHLNLDHMTPVQVEEATQIR